MTNYQKRSTYQKMPENFGVTETLEPMVVYQALYGDKGVWVRPLNMWDETVERDGAVYKRFTYIGE